MKHHHSEHKPDGMSHTMHEGHDMKGSRGNIRILRERANEAVWETLSMEEK